MAHARKVYDFPVQRVSNQILQVLKPKKQSTVAEIISRTGLPKHQVDQCLPALVDEYRGQMKVTESGEVLYYFPQGMQSRYKGLGPTLNKLWKAVSGTLAKVAAFLFKIWIMVMLVGYFILYIVLLVAAVLALTAASAAGNKNSSSSRSSRGGFGMFFLVTRLIQFSIELWIYSGMKKSLRGGKKTPFYKAVFAFVFGEPQNEEEYYRLEKTALIYEIQRKKGLISLEEIMALTGRDRESANQLVSRFLLEYEGDPQVSEAGTLYYFFPELLKVNASEIHRQSMPQREPIPFNNNPGNINLWVAFFNGFNALFGAYFLFHSLGDGGAKALEAGKVATQAVGQVPGQAVGFDVLHVFVTQLFEAMAPGNGPGMTLWILGLVPLSYSVLFFLIPFLRRLKEKKKNRQILQEQFQRKVFRGILESPLNVDAVSFQNQAPRSLGESPQKLFYRSLQNLADSRAIDVSQSSRGSETYSIPDLQRERQDLGRTREQLNLEQYSLGKVIFDSGE